MNTHCMHCGMDISGQGNRVTTRCATGCRRPVELAPDVPGRRDNPADYDVEEAVGLPVAFTSLTG